MFLLKKGHSNLMLLLRFCHALLLAMWILTSERLTIAPGHTQVG